MNPLDPGFESFVSNAPDGYKADAFWHPDKYFNQTKLVSDSGDDFIARYAAKLGMEVNESNRDYITQYVLNEMAQKSAWERQMEFENNRYQMTVKDLQKAGLNPFLAISGMSPGSASAGASSVQGGIYATNKKTNTNSATRVGVAAIAFLLGIIGAAAKASAMGG